MGLDKVKRWRHDAPLTSKMEKGQRCPKSPTLPRLELSQMELIVIHLPQDQRGEQQDLRHSLPFTKETLDP